MATPHSLNESQIKTYREDGFIVLDNFLTSAEVETLREAEASPAIQDALNAEGFAHKTVHLLELTQRHLAFLDLARDPRIVGAITSLLGPDVQLQHSKLATKSVAKGTGAFGWHQDMLFYPHSNTSLLSVFVYLDDATPENGCMSMVRGSQRLGALNHSDADGIFDGQCRAKEHWEDHPENVVPITPKAGAISIHHCMTLHGSPPNLSGKPRRGVVFSYSTDDALQLGGKIFEDTGLVVAGRRHGTVRCETGSWFLPRQTPHEYGNAHHQIGPWAQNANQQAGV